MPLTREFKETVQARLRSDPKYRKELLREGVECLLGGKVIHHLQKAEGLYFELSLRAAS